MGINPATFYRWKDKFGEFCEAIKKGKAPVDIQVENALLKRALGYQYEEVTTEIEDIPTGRTDEYGNPIFKQRKHIKKVAKTIPPETAAAFIWLKNRRPDKWRDKREYVADVSSGTLKNIQTIASLINNPVPDVDISELTGDDHDA